MSVLGGAPVMIGVEVASWSTWRTRTRALMWFLATVIVGEIVLRNVTKWIVDRPRPILDRLTGFSSSSFPSGHAVTAAATFAAVAFLADRGRPTIDELKPGGARRGS